MTKHITSISLDEETAKIASNLGNRSAFMRECLRRWNALETSTHIHPTVTPKCLPIAKTGLCQLCWPDGAPPHEAWLYYVQTGGRVFDEHGNISHHDYATDWIEDQARKNATPQFSIEGIEPSKPTPLRLRGVWWRDSLIARLSGFRKQSRR